MADYQSFKRKALAIDEASRKEEGTLAAYWRGYAAGMLETARRIENDNAYKDLVTSLTVKPRAKSKK